MRADPRADTLTHDRTAPPTTPPTAPILNVSGYLFTTVDDPAALRERLERELGACGVRGTVLVAGEGVNVALAGDADAVARARAALATDPRLAPLRLKESRSDAAPFARLKVRVRSEIIAFDGGRLDAAARAPAVTPDELARWLGDGLDDDGGDPGGDGRRAVRLLDTRNAYEIEAGAFEGAIDLGIGHFRDFRAAVEAALADGTLDLETPLVTYCTGGVRCEKAAPWLIGRGFEAVWQLDGGILGWLAARGGERWTGDCFVFDERVSVDAALAPTGATPCRGCGTAVRPGTRCGCGQLLRGTGAYSRTAAETV